MLLTFAAAVAGLAQIGVAWSLLFLLPALAIASWATGRLRDTSPLAGLALGFGLATHLVPALLFVVGAVLRVPIGYGLAIAVAAGILVALRRHVPPAIGVLREVGRGVLRVHRASPAYLALGFACAFTFAFQALFFDTILGFHFDCIYRPVALAAGWDPRAQPANPSLWYSDHQRLGVSEVLAPSMALFDFAGLRLQWGAIYAVVPLSLYVVARRIGLARGAAAAGAVVAGTLPWLVGYADQNRVILSTTSVLALVLSLRAPAPLIAGALAGIVFAEEPVAALGLGAVPLAMAWNPDARWRERRARWLAFAGLALAVAPAVARYKLAFGRLLFHEHFSYIPAMSYRVLGVELRLHAFFNWPLHDHLVRSPYNALPNLAMVPLNLVQQLSLPVAALGLAGVLHLAASRRMHALGPMLANFVPIAAFLAINENWVEREKGDIVIMGWVPVLLAVAAGVDALVHGESRRRGAIAFVGATVLLVGMQAALARIRAPEDTRLREAYASSIEALPPEDAEYLALERARWARIPLLPPVHVLRGREPSFLYGANARAFVEELGDRHAARDRFQHRNRDDGDESARYAGFPERVIRLDLATPINRGIGDGGGPIAVAPCPPGAPVTVLTPQSRGARIAVPWNPEPVEVMVGVAPRVMGFLLMVQRTNLFARRRREPPPPLAEGTCVELRGPAVPTIRLADKLSFQPSREYIYRVDPDPARADGALLVSLDR